MKTYVSLFSAAGVGCHGFTQAGFDCVATNELRESRLNVQRANHKCRYASGYICGDATDPLTHQRVLDEVNLWTQKGMDRVDVVFATPPCQGMSTVNYKKTDHEQRRNSLVMEAVQMVKKIQPRVFIFENVRAFLKSICTDVNGHNATIQECIHRHLSDRYSIAWRVMNFKDYGVPSSRPRTLVIGMDKSSGFSPYVLFPMQQRQIPLKESIGRLNRLAYGEKDTLDPFHFARVFPIHMLDWIKDLKEGETAFNNPDHAKPHSLDKNGQRVTNKGAYMGNKYRRLFWDKPGACIATRSDALSAHDTIHPSDNRVLSIRELMVLMTIPASFKWTSDDERLTPANSDAYLRANEANIRKCIGEAVPTVIMFEIAMKLDPLLESW